MTDTKARKCGWVLPLLVSLPLAAFACAKPLYQPPPLAAAGTPAQTRTAILRAVAQSNWVVDSERAGQVVARYTKEDDWTMAVAIDYAEQVTIRYADSENLDYAIKDGGPVIHGGYNRRVARLSKVIGRQIAMVRASEPLPAVASPPPAAAPTQ